MNHWEAITAVVMGIGLAASCGFRVFVPLLVLSIAANAGWVNLGESLSWIGSAAAMTAFGIASVLEVAAYKVPWLDHALDTVASPAAVVAGSVVAASQIGSISNMHPMLEWGAAIIAGGGAAAAVQAVSVGTRAASTALTGGVLNPIIGVGESLMSVILSVMAIVLPIVATIVLVTLLITGVVLVIVWRQRARTRAAAQCAAVNPPPIPTPVRAPIPATLRA